MVAPSPTTFSAGVGAVSADNLNSFPQIAYNLAQLRTLTGVSNGVALALGSAAPNDGGQGFYFYSAAGTFVDNGTTVIVPYGATAGAWLLLFALTSIGSVLQLNVPIQYADGTQKQSGDHKFHLTQVTAPATGVAYTNTNIFPIGIYWTATSTTGMALLSTNGNSLNIGAGSVTQTYFVYLPPGWGFKPTYTGTGTLKIAPAG